MYCMLKVVFAPSFAPGLCICGALKQVPRTHPSACSLSCCCRPTLKQKQKHDWIWFCNFFFCGCIETGSRPSFAYHIRTYSEHVRMHADFYGRHLGLTGSLSGYHTANHDRSSSIDSLESLVLNAVPRRRCTYSNQDLTALASAHGIPPGQVNNFLRQLVSQASSGGLLSSSGSAQQFAAFKAEMQHAAAAHTGVKATETGFTAHELFLMQHLRQPSANVWALADPKARSKAGAVTRSSSSAAPAPASPVKAEAELSHSSSVSRSSKSCSASSELQEWMLRQQVQEWKLFAEPPDCPVDSELFWAALRSNSSSETSRPHSES